MSEEVTPLRELFEKYRKLCEGLRLEIMHKDETIQKLTSELEASRIRSAACSKVYDAVIVGGMGKKYEWLIDNDFLMNKRREALERHRIEYENRVGTTQQVDSNHSDEGYDEVDSVRLRRG